jgi:hypothetical protein
MKKDILAPGTVILSNFKLVKKIEDLNEFWAVLKTQNRFMQGIECTHLLLFFLDIKNNRRLDKGRLLLDCYLAGNQSANFQLNKALTYRDDKKN